MQTIVSRLRCSYLENPIGLDEAQPRLFWQLQTAREGARQIAYQIRVASSPAKLAQPDFWDSGRVESNRSTHVPYEGAFLRDRDRAYWQVTVWDEVDGETTSDIAFWEIGLLARDDWQARAIGGTLSGSPRTGVPAPFLRREFEVAKPVKQARLYATALGVYECEINGSKAGTQIFAPGWTDYKQRVQYQTYDVTAHIRQGANAWGAVLGDGWYCGHVEWRGRQRYGERPHFFGQLEIEFEDGTRQIIATDEKWRHAYGPILQSDMLMGESHDARQEFDGWSEAGYDDAAWLPVQVNEGVLEGLKLCAPLGPPVVRYEEIVPVAEPHTHAALPSPAWVFDMGQNMVGRVRLKVSGPRGTTIRLRFAETLAGGPNATEGPIYTDNLRSSLQTDHYTLRGDGEEIWEPRFTFHGFRFVEMIGYPGQPTREAITGIVMHSQTPKTGDFECSDELVNQLQRNIDWGQRGNFVDVPTDCPQRDERLGWTGDAQVFARTAAFNRDVAAFFREWMRDVRDAQTRVGGISATVPDTGVLLADSGPHSGASSDGGPAWADAVLICPWTIYRCYGDKLILEENYEACVRYLEYLQASARDFIRCYDGCDYFPGFGDWLALDGSGRTEGGTPRDLIGTAFFAHAADLMSRIARVLGEEADAERYANLFQQVRAAFVQRFVTPAGLLSPPYQTPYLLALEFNLLPDELRETATQELVKNIERNGNRLATGFVSTAYLNHVLTQQGRLDVAYRLLFQKQWPSWLYAVTQGATTIWERWNGWTHDCGFEDIGMNSFNHYAYGAIGSWLYQVVAGIELDREAPGYERFVLCPQPGPGLTWAKAHLDTLHGRIESAWRIENGRFHWRFVVPPNTSAQVFVPGENPRAAAPGIHEISVPWSGGLQ